MSRLRNWRSEAKEYADKIDTDSASDIWEAAYEGYLFGCGRAKKGFSHAGNSVGIFGEAARTGFKDYKSWWCNNRLNRKLAEISGV